MTHSYAFLAYAHFRHGLGMRYTLSIAPRQATCETANTSIWTDKTNEHHIEQIRQNYRIGLYSHTLGMHTVRLRGIGTACISEASKRVPFFPFTDQGVKQAIPIFDRETGSKPARLGQARIRFQDDSV